MTERLRAPDGLVVHRSPLLASLAVPHLFTTRQGPGGVDLDLAGLGAGEHPHERRLLAEMGLDGGARLVCARQVHGADVYTVGPNLGPESPEADALVSCDPTRPVLVFSADCVPILATSADGACVAALHAGWRGLLAGVIARGIEALRARVGPKVEIVAAIGPCISRARFEVGPEVAEAFRAAELARAVHESPGARPHVDVRAAAAALLARAGVERVEVDPRCTWEDPELFSYRRDVTHGPLPRTGRLAAIVAPRRRG